MRCGRTMDPKGTTSYWRVRRLGVRFCPFGFESHRVAHFLLQVALAFATLLVVQPSAHAAPIEIVLRMDDSGYGRHETIKGAALSDAEITRRVIEIVTKYGAKISIAVIPNVVSGSPGYHPANPEYRPLSSCPEELSVLRDATKNPNVEICLHGWTHAALNRNRGWISEFGGQPLEDQTARLKQGREELEHCLGIPIDIFVPPFDNHDHETLQALQVLGFKAISSGAQKSDDVEGLRYVPNTASLGDLRSVVAKASQSSAPGFIMALFHGFDFAESGLPGAQLSLTEFDALLGEIAANPVVRFTSIAAAGRVGEHKFDAAESQLYAIYSDRIARVTDVARALGPFGAALRSQIPSAKLILPDVAMRHTAKFLRAIEIIVELALFAGVLSICFILMRLFGRSYWIRIPSRIVFAASGTCFLFFVLKGAFGILGAQGFGSRLVMAMSCTAAVLLATVSHWRNGGAEKLVRRGL
ncbi:MAG: DUF2334 domain-containing protein [Candidatus Hydrogenedentes bacterium]|nr:DUF2334 domain-containing protein [Candidatus Hydrogenedentota bacterium]